MLRRFRKGESWKRSQGQGVVQEAAVQDGGTGMIIGAEIILEGEVGVRVERGMDVTGTERGIIIVVAGVAAPVLIFTGGVAGTEALVVAGVAATLLMMTGGVAETVYRLCVEALVVHLAGHHLLVRDLLLSAMMTGLHALVALQHKLNINDGGWMEQDCSYQRLFSCLVVNALQLQTEMPPCLISVAASSCRYCFVDIWMLVRTIYVLHFLAIQPCLLSTQYYFSFSVLGTYFKW